MKQLLSGLPNMVTLLNLLFGCVAVVFALRGEALPAGYCIFFAAVCDFFDGFLARLLKAYSDIGKQLDSLADLVSFGVAPAAMLFYEMNMALSNKLAGDMSTFGWELLAFFPFIVALFSALRLAKFNVDTRQGDQFLGLPTPANALLIASFLMYTCTHPALYVFVNAPSIVMVSAMLSLLLVSETPMLALKFKGFSFKPNSRRYVFILLVLLIALFTLITGQVFTFAVMLIVLCYILYSIILLFIPRNS